MDSPTRRSAIIVGLLYAGYLWTTWSFISVFYGDYGLWMHEVDRVASGQVPYRDFSWEYPPLALMTYALAVRWFGDNVAVLFTLSAIVCFAIFVVYLAFARAVIDRALLTLFVVAILITSVAYSSIDSETLASGMYTPAAPIGGLLTIAGALLYVRLLTGSDQRVAVALGVILGLAVLSKPDFWLPAGCILAFAVVRLWTIGRRGSAAATIASFAAVIALGVGLIVFHAGWQNLVDGVTGYTAAQEEAGRMLPSWERIVGQLVLLSLFLLAVVICLKIGRAEPSRRLTTVAFGLSLAVFALVAVYVAGTLTHVAPVVESQDRTLNDPTARAFVNVANTWPTLVGQAVRLLLQRLRVNAWPMFFAPAALVWLAARWRTLPDQRLRHLCLFLLCLCIAARGRRLFEHIDWHHFLFEVPALLLVLKLAFSSQPRAILTASRVFGVGLLAAGSISFFEWTLTPALGLPTAGNLLPWGRPTPVETAHGRVRLPERDARAYMQVVALLDSIDPSRTAPVFSAGNQGPWAYFTGRPNPTPLTYGFSWSNRDPDAIIASLLAHEPKPIVIQEAIYFKRVYGVPEARLVLDRWEPPYLESYHTRVDGPLYKRILAHYELAGTVDGRQRSWSIHRWKGP